MRALCKAPALLAAKPAAPRKRSRRVAGVGAPLADEGMFGVSAHKMAVVDVAASEAGVGRSRFAAGSSTISLFL